MAIIRFSSLLATSSLLFLFTHAQLSPNTCTGRTLNVLSASLDWWYPQTYTTVASTFIVQYDPFNHSPTGWTLVAAATSATFDASAAVNSPSCATFTITESNASETLQICSSTPAPLAASTTVLTQTAYDAAFTATSGTGSVPYIATAPTTAAIAIPSSGGQYAAGTAFVFFSAYEILTEYAPSSSPATAAEGQDGCATATTTYAMPTPFSFEYAGNGSDVNGLELVNADVTGDVAPAFLSLVNATGQGVVAGSWVAAPTVVIVAEKVVAVLSSQSSLQTPSPTLVGGLSSYVLTLSTGGGAKTTVVPGSGSEASVLVTALELQLPSYSRTTSSSTSSSSSSSVYTGSPTNALEVLTAALAPFTSSSSSSTSSSLSITAAASSLVADAATAALSSSGGVTRLAETISAAQVQATTSSTAGGMRRRIGNVRETGWDSNWGLGIGSFIAAGMLAVAMML